MLAQFRALIVLLVVTGLSIIPAQSQSRTPEELVATINNGLIEAMKLGGGQDAFQARFDMLAPILEEAYNFPAMTRVIVGKSWTTLSDEQKESITEAFSRMSISTFAARFKNYTGQRFVIQGTKEGLRGSVIVENELISPDREPVRLNYVLRQFKGEWRVIDVQLGATVSELALRRSEYGSVISRDGFDALIGLLNNKIAEIEADASSTAS